MEEEGVPPTLAASWRCQAMSVFLIPLAIIELWKDKKVIPFFESRPDLEYTVYVHVLIAGVGWSATLLLWINGLKFISAVRASLFVNLHPLILVVYLYFKGLPVNWLDWLGVLFAILGVGVIGSDELLESDSENFSAIAQLFGGILCLIAAWSEFIVILNRKQKKKYVPLRQVRNNK